MVPQQLKPASESGRPAAERQFVDREEPIALFQAALREPQHTKPLVLVFHGGAGIGKSRLRHELVRQSVIDPNVVAASLDFAIPSYRQPESALLSLRKAIGEACQACFPSFDLAYGVLWQKTHPETPLHGKSGTVPRSACVELGAGQSPFSGDSGHVPDEVKPLLKPGSLLSQLLDESGKLPLIGLIPRVAALAAKPLESSTPRPLDPFLSDWWTKRGERELEDLPQMEPAEIVEQLPKLWAADLRDYLGAASLKLQAPSAEPVENQESESYHQDTKTQRGSRRMDTQGRRAVLFIDTYEKLRGAVDEGRGTEDPGHKTDAWVRGLVKQLPEALWVMSGRQKLRWEEAEKEWADVLRQHELGALPEHSAREFLSSCGITDEPIQDAIAKGSQGLPHYLNLAVDTFLEIKQAGQRVPSTSASSSTSQAETPEELFAQFIRHLDQPEIATLQALSASRFWNYGLFEHLVTEYQTGYPLTAYDDLSRFSFVGEGAAPETRTMHDLMREALQEHQAPELRKRVHLFLHELYARQLKGLDVRGITDKHQTALTEAFYHGRQAKNAAELWTWFQPAADVFSEAGLSRLLTPLYREIVQALETELGPEHPITATALHELGIILVNQDEYDEAELLYRRALAMAETGPGPEHPHYLDFLYMLAVLLNARGRFDEAEVLCRRMVRKLENEPGRDAAIRAAALDGLATALTHKGKYAEAEELIRRELAICESELGPDHEKTVIALNNLGLLFFEQDRYSESEQLARRVLAINERRLGANHPRVARNLGGLGASLRNLCRYTEAEPLLRRALKLVQEAYGPDHDITAVTMNNLAALLADQGRYAEAEALQRRALAVHEKKAGSDHPYTFRMANRLTIVLARQGKYAEAEPMAVSAIANRERKHGPDHPETAQALHTAGVVCSGQGRYAEADSYLHRALAVRTEVLGPDHPETLASLDALALLDEKQGGHAEAESRFRNVLEKREKAFGPDHPDVADTANRLAGLCCRDGRYAEAEALYRRALAIRERVFGPDHTFVAETLDGLAKVCEQTGRTAEAQELTTRAKAIREKNAKAAPAQAPSPS